MKNMDYYKILELDKNATPTDIKKAYKTLAIKFHPDRNPDDNNASEKMAALNEAYAVLSNPDKKREYDMLHERFGDNAAGRFRQSNSYEDILKNSDLEKIFQEIADNFGIRGLNELFSNVNINSNSGSFSNFNFSNHGIHGGGFFFFGTFGQNPQSGYTGSQDSIDRLNPNKTIIGEFSGKIAKKMVNKLINEGMKKLNISDESARMNSAEKMNDTSKTGFIKKDSYSKIDIKNRVDSSNNIDIYDTITLSLSHAEKGGPYAYHHQQSDKKFIVKIPENTKNGHKIRLKGAGIENTLTGEKGDMFLMVNIDNDISDSLTTKKSNTSVKSNKSGIFSKIKDFFSK